MSESQWSTICVVVVQSDHHCGDDLVLSGLVKMTFAFVAHNFIFYSYIIINKVEKYNL